MTMFMTLDDFPPLHVQDNLSVTASLHASVDDVKYASSSHQRAMMHPGHVIVRPMILISLFACLDLNYMSTFPGLLYSTASDCISFRQRQTSEPFEKTYNGTRLTI